MAAVLHLSNTGISSSDLTLGMGAYLHYTLYCAMQVVQWGHAKNPMKALSHEMNTFHDKKEMYHPGTSGT
jgi:hypothetical protein